MIRIILVALAVNFFISPIKSQAAIYQFTELGALGNGRNSVANAINNNGVIVGFSHTGTGPGLNRGFSYQNGVMTPIGTLRTLSDSGSSHAYGLNDQSNAQIVGNAHPDSIVYHAFLQSANQLIDIHQYSVGEGEPFFSKSSTARGVNNLGVVVGNGLINGSSNQRAYVFDGNNIVLLRTLDYPDRDITGSRSYAYSINDAGQIVGQSRYQSFKEHAFLYENGAVYDLGDLSSTGDRESAAFAINEAGHVVGEAQDDSGLKQAFLYTDTDGMTGLGTLLGTRYSSAKAINAYDQVVGHAWDTTQTDSLAFIYDNQTMQDLNQLVDASELGDWVLREANGINDQGQIVGMAFNSVTNVERAFLLTPIAAVPEPSTYLLMIIGVIVLTFRLKES